MRLLLEFDEHPQEQALVGRMLMAYGEFESQTAKLVGHAFDGNYALGGRIFWRVHGAAARIDVADAIIRPFFESIGLLGQWSNALGALRYCKDIRNQYAHCNWFTEKGKPLTFINFDKDVASPEGELMLQLYPTDLTLLQKQCEYFEYTNDWLFFLDCRCRRRRGVSAPDAVAPKSIPQPPKHNRPKKSQESPASCTTPKAPLGE